jgi:hypothetical protein
MSYRRTGISSKALRPPAGIPGIKANDQRNFAVPNYLRDGLRAVKIHLQGGAAPGED